MFHGTAVRLKHRYYNYFEVSKDKNIKMKGKPLDIFSVLFSFPAYFRLGLCHRWQIFVDLVLEVEEGHDFEGSVEEVP